VTSTVTERGAFVSTRRPDCWSRSAPCRSPNWPFASAVAPGRDYVLATTLRGNDVSLSASIPLSACSRPSAVSHRWPPQPRREQWRLRTHRQQGLGQRGGREDRREYGDKRRPSFDDTSGSRATESPNVTLNPGLHVGTSNLRPVVDVARRRPLYSIHEEEQHLPNKPPAGVEPATY